jgi:hypothetical protein
LSSHWDTGRSLDVPCRCNAGRFVVDYRSENYPPFRVECYGRIDCPTCSETYRIWAGGWSDVRLYRHADDKAFAAAHRERHAEANALLEASPAVQDLRSAVAGLLDGATTKIEKYRRLAAHKLVRGSLATFRRYYVNDETAITEIVLSWYNWAATRLSGLVWRLKRPEIVEAVRRYNEIVGDSERDHARVPFEQLAKKLL